MLGTRTRARLRQINAQLSSLTTQFQQNVRQATQSGAVVVDSVAQLDGFSAEQIGAAAARRGGPRLDRQMADRPTKHHGSTGAGPAQESPLRERIYRASIARSNGGAADNTGLIVQIVRLRAERAELLGYANYAAYVLEDETAGTARAVNELLGELAPPAIAKAKREASDLQALIDRQAKAEHTRPFELEAWDWAFYAEQLRQARFAYDESQVKPYFELNRVLQDGVFFAATRFYGIHVRRASRSAALPAGRARVRGLRSRRLAARSVFL